MREIVAYNVAFKGEVLKICHIDAVFTFDCED